MPKSSTNSPKTRSNSLRKQVAKRVLMERLGLEDDWRDPEFPVQLPTALPPNPGNKLTESDRHIIRVNLTHLVDLGCEIQVLYWCVGQLNKDAEEIRQGKKIVVEAREDESKNRERVQLPLMATRQDMQSLIAKIDAVTQAIRQYREELFWVADSAGTSVPLPGGFTSEPESADEIIPGLLQSLNWVRRLADKWESPNASSLLKNKGVLFLLVYVWQRLTDSHPGNHKTKRSSPRQTTKYRLPPVVVQRIAEVAFAYVGGGNFDAQGLNDKLQDFATKEPDVFKVLLALVNRLDKAAKAASKT